MAFKELLRVYKCYENKVDDSSGIARMRSGYNLIPSRNTIIPSGYDKGDEEQGIFPPTLSDYPIGSFVEDYRYAPDKTIDN